MLTGMLPGFSHEVNKEVKLAKCKKKGSVMYSTLSM